MSEVEKSDCDKYEEDAEQKIRDLDEKRSGGPAESRQRDISDLRNQLEIEPPEKWR